MEAGVSLVASERILKSFILSESGFIDKRGLQLFYFLLFSLYETGLATGSGPRWELRVLAYTGVTMGLRRGECATEGVQTRTPW